MSKKQSAGFLAYKIDDAGEVKFLLSHPGGPYWKNKDEWSIPKGKVEEGETTLQGAFREFCEETGCDLQALMDSDEFAGDWIRPKFIELGYITQSKKKNVWAWGIEASLDETIMKSNECSMEYPPKSGNVISFPEIEGFRWFSYSEAKDKMHKKQFEFVERVMSFLKMGK
jgi:predicted NUDIX family NTP pyrophosphohydrolase